MAEEGRTVLTIPKTPTSANEKGFRDPRGFTRVKREWEAEIAAMLAVEGLRHRPQLRVVRASATLRFTTRRRRDEGNMRILLEKALGDVLTGGQAWRPTGKWLPDDSFTYFQFGHVEISPDPGPARTVLLLEWWR